MKLTLRTLNASTVMSWSEEPLDDGSQDHVVAMVVAWPLLKLRSIMEAPYVLQWKSVNVLGVFWRV